MSDDLGKTQGKLLTEAQQQIENLTKRIGDMERNQKLIEDALNLLFQISVPAAAASRIALENIKTNFVAMGLSPPLDYSSLIDRISLSLDNLQREAEKNAPP